MVCLDTTVWIDLMRSRRNPRYQAATALLERLRRENETIALTRFNLAELLSGIESDSDPIAARQKLDAILDGIIVLEFDEAATERFAKIDHHLRSFGTPIGDMDMLIGATGAVNRVPIYTRNPDHFRQIPGLLVAEY